MKIFNNIIIYVFIICFITESVTGYAVPVYVSDETSKSFNIPSSYGEIARKKMYSGTIPEIILIGDAHCNYEAQKNIAGIIKILLKQYGAGFIGVEGASGIVDVKRFNKFKDEKKKEKVLDEFVKKGYITGPEFLKITKGQDMPVELYGVEDTNVYKENFGALKDALKELEKSEEALVRIKAVVNRQKDRFFSERLKDFDLKTAEYNENKSGVTDYIKFLNEYGRLNYNNIRLVLKAIRIEEKIDFGKAEKEKEQLIDELQKMPAGEDTRELVKKCLEFKSGRIDALKYYGYLSGKADIKKFKELFKYIELLKVRSKIDAGGLVKEIETAQTDIYAVLAEDEKQKDLIRISRNLDVLDKLIHLKLSSAEYEYYKLHIDEFGSRFIYAGAELFYRIARRRSEIMLANLLKNLPKGKPAVLITGGFHIDGIAKLLEEKNISYAVIRPRITNAGGDDTYFSILKESIGNENMALPTFADPGNPATRIDEGFRRLAGQIDRELMRQLEGVSGRKERLLRFLTANWTTFPEIAREIFVKEFAADLALLFEKEMEKLEEEMARKYYPDALIENYKIITRDWERMLKLSGMEDKRKDIKIVINACNDSESLNRLLKSIYTELKVFEYGKRIEVWVVEHSDILSERDANNEAVSRWDAEFNKSGRRDRMVRYISLQEQYDFVEKVNGITGRRIEKDFLNAGEAEWPERIARAGFAAGINISLMMLQAELMPEDKDTLIMFLDQDVDLGALLVAGNKLRRRKVTHTFHHISKGFKSGDVDILACTLNGDSADPYSGLYESLKEIKAILVELAGTRESGRLWQTNEYLYTEDARQVPTAEFVEILAQVAAGIENFGYSGFFNYSYEGDKLPSNIKGRTINPFGTGFIMTAETIAQFPFFNLDGASDIYYQFLLRICGKEINSINVPVMHNRRYPESKKISVEGLKENYRLYVDMRLSKWLFEKLYAAGIRLEDLKDENFYLYKEGCIRIGERFINIGKIIEEIKRDYLLFLRTLERETAEILRMLSLDSCGERLGAENIRKIEEVFSRLCQALGAAGDEVEREIEAGDVYTELLDVMAHFTQEWPEQIRVWQEVMSKIEKPRKDDRPAVGLDMRPVKNELLDTAFVGYDMAVKRMINPDDKPIVGVYGGAGADISHFLLATNADVGYFVDTNYGWENKEPEIDDLIAYKEHKYRKGYGYIENLNRKYIYLFIAELRAIGVPAGDIRKIRKKINRYIRRGGNIIIKFNWAYPGQKPRKRTIYFVGADITEPGSYTAGLERVLASGIDFYFQNAGMEIPQRYGNFLERIAKAVKPGGFLVMDNVDGRFVQHVPMRYIKEHSIREVMPDRDVLFWWKMLAPVFHQTNGYGWCRDVYRKASLEPAINGMQLFLNKGQPGILPEYISQDICVNGMPIGKQGIERCMAEARMAVDLYKNDRKNKYCQIAVNGTEDTYWIIEYEGRYFVVRQDLLAELMYNEKDFIERIVNVLKRENETVEELEPYLPEYIRRFASWRDLPEVMLIEEMSYSPYLGANCTNDGWLGINECLKKIKFDKLKDMLFEAALLHELWHEGGADVTEEFLLRHDEACLFYWLLDSCLSFVESCDILRDYFSTSIYREGLLLLRNKIIKQVLAKMSGQDAAERKKAADLLIRIGGKFNPETGMVFMGSMKHWLIRHGLLEGYQVTEYDGLDRNIARSYRSLMSMRYSEVKRQICSFCDLRGIPYPSNLESLCKKGRMGGIVSWMLNALYRDDLEVRGGTLFGEDIGNKRFEELAIWPVDSEGRLRNELFASWLCSWQREPSDEYLEAKKVSLNEFCNLNMPRSVLPPAEPVQLNLFGTESAQGSIMHDLRDEGLRGWRLKVTVPGQEAERLRDIIAMLKGLFGEFVIRDEISREALLSAVEDVSIKIGEREDAVYDSNSKTIAITLSGAARINEEDLRYLIGEAVRQIRCPVVLDAEVVEGILEEDDGQLSWQDTPSIIEVEVEEMDTIDSVIRDIEEALGELGRLSPQAERGILTSHEMTRMKEVILNARIEGNIRKLRELMKRAEREGDREGYMNALRFFADKLPVGRLARLYRRLPERYRSIISKDQLNEILFAGRLPAGWQSLKDLIGDRQKNAAVIADIGREVEKAGGGLGLTQEQGALIAEAIAVRVLSRDGGRNTGDMQRIQGIIVPQGSEYYAEDWQKGGVTGAAEIAAGIKKFKQVKYKGFTFIIDPDLIEMLGLYGLSEIEVIGQIKDDFNIVRNHLHSTGYKVAPRTITFILADKGPNPGGNCKSDNIVVITDFFGKLCQLLDSENPVHAETILRFLLIHEFIHELGGGEITSETFVEGVSVLLFLNISYEYRIALHNLLVQLAGHMLLDRESYYFETIQDELPEGRVKCRRHGHMGKIIKLILKNKIDEAAEQIRNNPYGEDPQNYVCRIIDLMVDSCFKTFAGDTPRIYILIKRLIRLAYETLDEEMREMEVKKLTLLLSILNLRGETDSRKRYLMERIEEKNSGDLSLSIPELEGFAVDFPDARLKRQYDKEDLDYLACIYRIEDDIRLLANSGVSNADEEIMVVDDIGQFVNRYSVDTEKGIIEFSYNPGLSAIIKVLKHSPKIHFGFTVRESDRRIIEKILQATGLLGRQIHLFSGTDSFMDIQEQAKEKVKGLTSNHIVFLANYKFKRAITRDTGLRKMIRNNELKVVGVDPDSVFYCTMLFAVLYARAGDIFMETGRGLTDNAKSVFRALELFGIPKKTTGRWRKDLREGLFFSVKIIRLEEVLEDFELHKLYIDASA